MLLRQSLAAIFRTIIQPAATGLIILLGFAAPAIAQSPPGSGTNHISVALVPESRAPAAGKATTIAISMSPQSGWHGYWRTPGDAGLPSKLTWTLPSGVEAGTPAYPVPRRLLIADLMNYVYDRPYALLVPVTIGPGLAVGTKLKIALKMDYLACTREACLPETADVSAIIEIGNGATDPAVAQNFALWRKALSTNSAETATHSFANGRFRLSVPVVGDIGDDPYLFIDDQDAVNFASPQAFSRSGNTLIVETAASNGASQKALKALLDLGNGRGLEIVSQAGTVPAAGEPLSGAPDQKNATNKIVLTLMAFAGAILGGLILNIMPCVFPILSLKALSLARSAEDYGGARTEAVAYSAGVIFVCVLLGALILALRAAGTQVGWAFQLQSPGVVFGLILLVGAIGFNLAGLFEFSTISAGSDLAAKSGPAGAFWTGALAAFVATPCTGPFMAAALGAALVLPTIAALLIFVGLGLGLSLPFLAIGFVPRFRRMLPKPGAWMNTFRHVLAVPMFVTALGLAWVLGGQTGTTGIILSMAALLILSLGLWAMGLRQRSMERHAWMPAVAGLVLAATLAPLLPTRVDAAQAAQIAGHEPFDNAKLEHLRAKGTPVFLYLTADWCLTCKVNEKAAIERSETQDAFKKAGVVTMVGDWTNGNAEITKFLEKNGRSGVPLYLWYSPGKEAVVLPQILTISILASLAENAK